MTSMCNEVKYMKIRKLKKEIIKKTKNHQRMNTRDIKLVFSDI